MPLLTCINFDKNDLNNYVGIHIKKLTNVNTYIKVTIILINFSLKFTELTKYT